MSSKKMPSDTIRICMQADHINAMVALFDEIVRLDAENSVAIRAAKLKEKILKHGRTYCSGEEDCVSLYLYPSEIVALIEILALMVHVCQPVETDYFPMIGRVKKERSVRR